MDLQTLLNGSVVTFVSIVLIVYDDACLTGDILVMLECPEQNRKTTQGAIFLNHWIVDEESTWYNIANRS